MKINDLINQLKELKKLHGNCNIWKNVCGGAATRKFEFLELDKNEYFVDYDNLHTNGIYEEKEIICTGLMIYS